MRTGLVAIGGIIAVLGAGLILTLFFVSSGPSITTQIRTEDPSLSNQSLASWVVPGAAGGSGSISLTWTSTAPADVRLWPATSCASPGGFCPTGVPALNWSKAVSGRGSVSTASGSTYVLIVDNPGNFSLRFVGLLSVTFIPGMLVPAWSWGLIAAGGIALLTIGGIALFLGLFLPSGVFRDPDRGPIAVRHPSLTPDDPEASYEPETDGFEEPP